MSLTTADIHNQMSRKGFWDASAMQWDFMAYKTNSQLLHAVIELGEYYISEDVEEAADVAIVLFDLLGAHGFDFDLTAIEPAAMADDLWALVAEVADKYRKTRRLEPGLLIGVIAALMEEWGQATFISAVVDKCAKNESRPARYGVAE